VGALLGKKATPNLLIDQTVLEVVIQDDLVGEVPMKLHVSSQRKI
jgi:hypothetical protein